MQLVKAIDAPTIVTVLKGLIRGSIAINKTSTASSGKPRGERTMLSIVKVRMPDCPDVAIPARTDVNNNVISPTIFKFSL